MFIDGIMVNCGTAASTVLLIPCHLPKANHWVLTARIKIGRGHHKFFLFDSQGAKAGKKRVKRIREPLQAIGLVGSNDTCSILNVKEQTEWECGARTAQYIMNFVTWTKNTSDGVTIIRQMQRGVAYEKRGRCDLAVESRKTLSNHLRKWKK